VTSDALVLSVSRLAPAADIKLSVLRGGQPRTLTANLTKAHMVGHRVVTNPPATWRGLQVDYPTALISPQELSEIPAGCVAVRSSSADSPAAKSGLTKGMLISAVGDRICHSPAAFLQAVRELDGSVELTVRGADGQSRKVTISEQ
jgi:S1-C subfamily serine protease